MAIYHFTVSVGSRATGQLAAAKAQYISRLGRYSRRSESVTHIESFNMPTWAEVGSAKSKAAALCYWRAADKRERLNGVLFRSFEAALPLELDQAQQLALTRAFVIHVSKIAAGKLPVTFAIHAGGTDASNPHVHVMLSERIGDEIVRDEAHWFRRASPRGTDPKAGGARKADISSSRKDWLAAVRQGWAEAVNHALQSAGSSARIDHRSNEMRGISDIAGVHMGPKASAMERRGIPTDRRVVAANQNQSRRKYREVSRDYARLQNDYIAVSAEIERGQALIKSRRLIVRRGAKAPIMKGSDTSQASSPGTWIERLRLDKYRNQIASFVFQQDGSAQILLGDGTQIVDFGDELHIEGTLSAAVIQLVAIAAFAKGWTSAEVWGEDQWVSRISEELATRGIEVVCLNDAQRALVAEAVDRGKAKRVSWTKGRSTLSFQKPNGPTQEITHGN